MPCTLPCTLACDLHPLQRVYQYHRDKASNQITEDHVLGVYDAKATGAAAKRDELSAHTPAARAWQEQQAALQQAGAGTGADAAGGQGAGGKAEGGSKEGAAGRDGKKGATAASGSDAAPEEEQQQQAGKQQQPGKQPPPPVPPPMLELLDLLPDKPGMADSWWPYSRSLYLDGERCAMEGGGRARMVRACTRLLLLLVHGCAAAGPLLLQWPCCVLQGGALLCTALHLPRSHTRTHAAAASRAAWPRPVARWRCASRARQT